MALVSCPAFASAYPHPWRSYVTVDQEIEASALAKPFNVAVNRVGGEGSAALGRKDEARVGKLPAKFSER
jgi:hypothetical protein